jgi:hypothetical protein
VLLIKGSLALLLELLKIILLQILKVIQRRRVLINGELESETTVQ